MSDEVDGLRLTRRRLLGGVTTIGVASAGTGVGTWAAWSDTVDSNDNRVEGGDLDLKVDDDDGYQDSVSGTWSVSGLVPGGVGKTANIDLKNFGSVEADHVQLAFEYTEDTAGFAEQLALEGFYYDGMNLLHDIGDTNGNGFDDLDDLTHEDNKDALDDLPAPPPSGDQSEPLIMEFNLHEGADDQYQGAELTFTLTMALHQLESQDIDD